MTTWAEQRRERDAVAIVAADDDALAAGVGSALRAARVEVLWVFPDALAATPARLEGRRLWLAGRPVSGLLFRARRDAGSGAGCSPDARAVWLAALSLDGVLALNRCDAWAWFDSSSETLWRRVLLAAGVPLSPLA